MSNYTVQWASGGTQSIPGKSSIILTDGETDSLNTSLTLTGRNVVTYGQIQQENFIQVLENSASIFSPSNPTVGQLWYNVSAASAGRLYVCIAPAGTNVQPPNSFEAQCIPGTTQSGPDGSFWAPATYLYRPLNATGDTMGGSLSMGGNIITNLDVSASPNANDAVNVGYMESRITAIVGGAIVNTYTAGTGLSLNATGTFTNTGVLSITGGQNISVTVGQSPVISLTGIVPSASYAATAGTITATPNSSNVSYPVSLLSSASGSVDILSTSSLVFNPSSGQLSATSFVGNLVGNAQTATLATSANKLTGGGTGYLPYQNGSNSTIMLPPGSNGQVLTISGGVPTWMSVVATSTVSSFNNRTGTVTLTSGDVTSALGYTPAQPSAVVSSFNGRTGAVTLSSSDVSNALSYTPQPNLGFTPIQQGGGAGQGANKIYIGWGSGLDLQVDTTNFANNWPISISGNAATASNAAYATSAGSANTANSASSAGYATTAGNGGVTSVNGATGAVTLPAYLSVTEQSFSQNGYTRLSSGLMFQWGYALHSGGSGSVVSHSFPIAFPSTMINMQLTQVGNVSLNGDNGPLTVSSSSASGFNTYSTNDPGAVYFYWFAIGV